MKFYRYVDTLYTGNQIGISCYVYDLLKETKKGYWILPEWFYHDNNEEEDKLRVDREKRWIKKDALRRYACPTKEEAVVSFIARKKKQIKILKAQLENATTAYNKGLLMAEGKDQSSPSRVYKLGALRKSRNAV